MVDMRSLGLSLTRLSYYAVLMLSTDAFVLFNATAVDPMIPQVEVVADCKDGYFAPLAWRHCNIAIDMLPMSLPEEHGDQLFYDHGPDPRFTLPRIQRSETCEIVVQISRRLGQEYSSWKAIRKALFTVNDECVRNQGRTGLARLGRSKGIRVALYGFIPETASNLTLPVL